MGGRAALVVSSGLVHPSPLARAALAAAVRAAGFAVETAAAPDAFRRLDPARHAAAVVFFHRRAIEAADLDALAAYVGAGGGLLALHGAIASFKDEPRWAALLGAGFGGHDRPTLLAVGPAADPGPFAGVPGFMLKDELYRLRVTAPIEARLSALPAAGGSPAATVAWTRRHGRGRICCCTLGHAAAALRHPSLRRVVAAALAWVAAAEEDSRRGP
jgi:hypothetical protein